MVPLVALLWACADPGESPQTLGYRPDYDGPSSGERGNVKVSEVGWAGSVTDDGRWDPTDVFVELRNEGSRRVNPSRWQLQVDGAFARTFVLPDSDRVLDVGEHAFVAAKTSGCFPDPDWVIPELALPFDQPLRVTLKDVDERLIDSAGSAHDPPFAGGYDLVQARSMERVELMFGGQGSEPEVWHYYTQSPVDVVNNDRVADGCRVNTLASPGRPNSPDYSGAFASGSFE
jgi:hypothetical protein